VSIKRQKEYLEGKREREQRVGNKEDGTGQYRVMHDKELYLHHHQVTFT
jgi:hypothetical protein